MKKNRFFNGVIVIMLLILSVSCNDDKRKGEPVLKVASDVANLQSGRSKKVISITTNGDYNVTISPQSATKWCSVAKEDGRIIITASENDNKERRDCKVILDLDGAKQEIKVFQLGWGKEILVNSKELTADFKGEQLELKVTANVEYELDFSKISWAKEVKTNTRAAHDPVETTHRILVSTNSTEGKREGEITIKDKDPKSTISPVVVKIIQGGIKEFTPPSTVEIKDDIKLKVAGGRAENHQSGEDISKSFDGNRQTLFHSRWANGGANYFPVVLEYDLDNEDVDYIVYYPRPEGHNGNFKETKVEVTYVVNGQERTEVVADYDFGGTNDPVKIVFDRRKTGVKKVKFTVKSGTGANGGFASCSEMEFYKYNPNQFDPSLLFADKICSKLKDGITEEEIAACPDDMYKNMALFMFKNKYPREFRIAEFKAYPHPNVAGEECKTNPYSLLDNPTGINVENGQDLVVFVDDNARGQRISLRVMNLDKPGGDGFHDVTTYPLSPGLNKLTMTRTGLAYVMYHTPDYQTAPTIKMHFATGNVNGYYDIAKHTDPKDWMRLLNNASYKFFDVVGRYAHLTFPTERFRQHTVGAGKELIETYDLIVNSEMEFLGLYKYNRVFKNRMYLHVMYHSYMYATWYHTAYNETTLPGLCHPSTLRKQCWGPAHEIGHCNQTRPAVLWRGMTEVTTNIKSEYIQTTVFNQPSRLQIEDHGAYKSRYGKAFTLIMAAKKPHNFFEGDEQIDSNSNEAAGVVNNSNGTNHSSYCRATPKVNIEAAGGGDVFCKLVPFWQLELYFGKVLGRTPTKQEDKGGFYPDLYEEARKHTNQTLPTTADQQLNFVVMASKVAQMDLTDFFEKWGFLKPVHRHIGDYSNECLYITQEMVDRTKEQVRRMNLPKPTLAIEFITDLTVDLYKNPRPVVLGTAVRSGRKLTFKNFSNVVVYEVVDTNTNNQVFISDGKNTESNVAEFSLTSDWKDHYVVNAVAADGTRTRISF